MEEKIQENAKHSVEIAYHGKTLPIKNEKTLLAMQKIEELGKVIHKMDGNQADIDDESGESTKLSNLDLCG